MVSLSYSRSRILGLCNLENPKAFMSSGSWLKSSKPSLWIARKSFSDSSAQKVNGKGLPWLSSTEGNKVWREKKEFTKPGRSSWVDSARKLETASIRSSWEESAQRLEKVKIKSFSEKSAMALGREQDQDTTWEKSAKRLNRESSKSSRDEFTKRRGASTFGSREARNKSVGMVEDHQTNYASEYKDLDEDGEVEEEDVEAEVVGDPRWDRIKSRYRGVVDERNGNEKPEFRKWNKQENWGRRTWKEATESSVPKMIGEGVYGVGPVLAALSAGRREFYALYVQEGLDLSNNNRKKKDKKGFEKILKMAEKLSLSINHVSKHDLNMIVDSRPHQGLVLDASPLEMVKIKELDPVSVEQDKNSLWVALDEVTDPQNLGAIIRSAYFFGATGVVLCAKNSAPLSGVVSKASAGSLELMELRFCKNMMQFLIFSAENGWRVLGGSVSSKAVPLNEVEPGAPTILVLGSEGAGLRPLVEKSCTQLVRIPTNVSVGKVLNIEDGTETAEKNPGGSAADFQSFLAVESLNVSVAAGVLLHHLIGDNYYNDNAGESDQPTTNTLE